MVIWADPAKSDLRAIHDFIASDSKYYAKKMELHIQYSVFRRQNAGRGKVFAANMRIILNSVS